MGVVSVVTDTDASGDAGYPFDTPIDPLFPARTLEPVSPVFEGVALPSTWSRLRAPLERALRQLWETSGLSARGRPDAWVSLHSGRITVNAHGWERLRAALCEEEPDPELVGPPGSGLSLLGAFLERLRVRRRRARLRARLTQARGRASAALDRLESVDVRALDTPPLARGPLDEWTWTEMLLPWLADRAMEDDEQDSSSRVERGLRTEQRYVSEVGRRLVNSGILRERGDVAYLTVEERIQAAVQSAADGTEFWMRVIQERAQRVDAYADVDLPERFPDPSAGDGGPQPAHEGEEG